jgi:hypothetical protein
MRRAAFLLLSVLATTTAHVACSDDDVEATGPKPAGDASDDVTNDVAAPDAGSDTGARRQKLAASGAQFYVKGGFGIELRTANLATDTDLFAVHQDFYGIPWDAFEAGTDPPAPWTTQIDKVVSDARAANKGVFLSLTPLNGGRNTLAPRVAADGSRTDNWAGACYDFASAGGDAKRTAYVRYVNWMIDRFAPDFIAIGIEVNLFDEQCSAAWDALVVTLNAAYDAAKAKRPTAAVFPTIQLDHLLGFAKESCADQSNRQPCFDAHYTRLAALKRDRFAMSTYPYLSGLTNPDDVPADWFARAPTRGAERAVIAETGWLSTPIEVEGAPGQCAKAIDFSEATAKKWLDRVLAARTAQDMDLVTWISDRDVLDDRLMTDCPCTFDPDWCALRDYYRDAGGPDSAVSGELALKAFGAMGLRRYDGTPRPTLIDSWQQALR